MVLFAAGVADVALMVWIPLAWTTAVSLAPSQLIGFPLLAASPNPLATYLQSVFVGVILAVRGAQVYARSAPIGKGLALSALSVLFMLSSMVSFTYQDVNFSLIFLLLAVLLFAL